MNRNCKLDLRAKYNLSRMIIRFNYPGGTDVEEWGMIELQGEIIDKTDGSLSGKVIGDLHFTRQNIPVLIIGHNMLHGEIVNLPKPFAVLRRVKKYNDAEMFVSAVIRRKIIFRVRPKPIIWMQK